MEHQVQPTRKFKLYAVLKLVVLGKHDPIDLKIRHRAKWAPLSPNEFNVYAYPELRYGYHDDNALNHQYEDSQQLDLSDFGNGIIDTKTKVNLSSDSSIIDTSVEVENEIEHNEEYIENLHREIDKRARLEFSKEMGEAVNNSDLKSILGNIENTNGVNNGLDKNSIDLDKLEIKESVKPVPIMQAVSPTPLSSLPKSTSNNLPIIDRQSTSKIESKPHAESTKKSDNEVKFRINIDKNEKNKYYTDVLDAVDKIFDEQGEKSYRTMTEIIDEVLNSNSNNKKNKN